MKQILSAVVRTAMLRVAIVLGAGFAQLSIAAEPIPVSPLEQSQAAAKSAYANKLICTTEKVIGSHIGKRKCRTQQQIDERRAKSQEWLRTLHTNSGINTEPGE